MNSMISNLRVEKTNKNDDDFRVLMAGSLFLIFIILMQPIVMKAYDVWFAERPFVSATVEILAVEGSDIPVILYDADATQNVKGQWIASIYHLENGTEARVTSRRGQGSYNTNVDNPRVWTWSAWFDNETDTGAPEVPTNPFKVCVTYVVNSSRSGIEDQTPSFCSSYYDPKDPKHQFYDFARDGKIQ